MKNYCGLSSWSFAVMMTAVVACSSPQSLVVGDDGRGSDAGCDASGDSGGHPHADSSVMPDGDSGGHPHADSSVTPDGDSGGDPHTDGGVTPDASEPGDLVAMCGSVPTTTEDWEQCRVQRSCEEIVNCTEQNLYASAQECIVLSNALTGGEIAFDTFKRARSVAAGRASIDVAAFTQCLTELSPQRCATAFHAPSCAVRYTGTVADGQACFSDAECISPGASCTPHDCGASCCMGTCTPRAKLGQPCQDFEACEPGLVCSVTSLTCVSGDVGSTCGHFDCDDGTWCDNGTCKPDVPEGAACDSLLQCGGETSCVGKFRPVEPAHCGHLTSVGDACDWFCLGNLYCDLSNPEGFGVCRSLPTINEPCSFLRPCLGQNLRCGEQGVCIPRTGLNQPCTDGTCLPGLFCTDQLGAMNPVCRAPLADGESGCKQDAQCQSHICGNQTTPGQCLAVKPTCP